MKLRGCLRSSIESDINSTADAYIVRYSWVWRLTDYEDDKTVVRAIWSWIWDSLNRDSIRDFE
jgi:hypothetical protein